MVMDLPATDPGSDMYYDLTDSADENHSRILTYQLPNRSKYFDFI